MGFTPLLLSTLLAVVILSYPGVAAAQNGGQRGSDYDYVFEDDAMVGGTLSSTPPLLTVRRCGLRVSLLRPRASFVAEMLKSVEVL